MYVSLNGKLEMEKQYGTGRVTHWVKFGVEKENSPDGLLCICLSLDTYAHTHTNTENVFDPALLYARAYLSRR